MLRDQRSRDIILAVGRLRAEMILEQLAVRGIQVSAEQRDRILEERDRDVLIGWARRVLSCADIDELFVPTGSNS